MSIQKPPASTRILVEPPLVTFTGPVAFDVPDTATLLEGFPEPERLDQLRRILELGTQAVGTISTSTMLRMVEAQMASMTQEMGVALSGLLVNDRAEAQKVIKELLDEHRTKVASNLAK